MSTKIQLKKINQLHNCIQDCDVYQRTPPENVILLPTGDGMCLGFLQGVDLPLKLAIQLHEKLDEYNKGKIPAEMISVRIGLHSGNFFTFVGLDKRQHFWGPGIIIAKRVMDIGNADHILLSSTLAETLIEISDEYRQIIKPIGNYAIKHDIIMSIYSAYGKNLGNQIAPTSNTHQKNTVKKEILTDQNSALYPAINVELTLQDEASMLVHHKRTYEIENTTDEPIKFVLHGIATDVEKSSLNDLNLKIYDDSKTEMKISSVNLDKPHSKEFSTVFVQPILKGQKNRSYTLEYEVEEPLRFYENTFLINCKKFRISFLYNPDFKISTASLYYVNIENNEKYKAESEPSVEKINGLVRLVWSINDVVKGQTLRLEW